MKTIETIIDAAIKQGKIERQQAEKEVKDENIEAIVEYFGNDAGLEKVVRSFGVDYNALSVDATNGLLFCSEDCVAKVFDGDEGCVNILIDNGRIVWKEKFND